MGLNGKAVLPMVLGLGCDTMATLTTRILESRKERMIVIILLALGVPCSAQLTCHPGECWRTLSWMAALAVWVAILVVAIALVGTVGFLALPHPGRENPRTSYVELPPLRMAEASPTLLHKTLARMEWYLKEAVAALHSGNAFPLRGRPAACCCECVRSAFQAP